MNTLGQLLLLSGIVLATVGTWTVYSSLRIYSNCALSGICEVDSPVYIQFLDTQALGNTLTIFGAMCLSMGSIFIASSQARTPTPARAEKEEERVRVAQAV